MSDPVYGDQFAALRQENARLRAQLDATAQAHERDVVRIARALGWTHEPPASVDEVVERVTALHAENARLTAERDAQLTAARRASDRRAWQVKERARAVAHSTDDAHVIRRLLTELGTNERSQPDPAAQRDEALAEVARLTAERDALTRGEDTPSLDAIRAHGGVWVVTDGSSPTTLSLHADAATVHVILTRGGRALYYDAERFAELYAGCRWCRVRRDGTLAVGNAGGGQ